jgi:hypothetical protein
MRWLTLTALKKLHLNNGGAIASLKPLLNLDGLESVMFYESTNIVDGDLSPLLRQKNLARISFQNRRHYSHQRIFWRGLLEINMAQSDQLLRSGCGEGRSSVLRTAAGLDREQGTARKPAHWRLERPGGLGDHACGPGPTHRERIRSGRGA